MSLRRALRNARKRMDYGIGVAPEVAPAIEEALRNLNTHRKEEDPTPQKERPTREE